MFYRLRPSAARPARSLACTAAVSALGLAAGFGRDGKQRGRGRGLLLLGAPPLETRAPGCLLTCLGNGYGPVMAAVTG